MAMHDQEVGEPRTRRARHYREVNVFDAVAGRVARTSAGRVDDKPRDEGNVTFWAPLNNTTSGGYYSSHDARSTPQEVLFRRKNAPPRYQEKDIYFANEELPDGGRRLLPDSDTLKTVHNYTSHFYEALTPSQTTQLRGGSGFVDERSFDETALLAFGILLEEACRETIRKRGDQVFTEGQNIDVIGDFWKRRYRKRRKMTPA